MSHRRRDESGSQHLFFALKTTSGLRSGLHTNKLATMVYNEFKMRSDGRPVELILGIKPSGVSELLITQLEENYFWHRHLTFHRRSKDEYESLSPIRFDSDEALKKKLNKLDKDHSRYKNSQSQDGVSMGQHEYGRLYRMLVVENFRDCVRFGITLAARSQILAARVKSLAFTRWSVRNPHNPKAIEVLDIGISEADTVDISSTPASTKRFKHSRNHSMLQKDSVEGKTTIGSEEVLDEDMIRDCLREFTALSPSNPSPVLLLVHDEPKTLQVLDDFGVDTTGWVSGIKVLFHPSRANPRPQIYVLDIKNIYEKLYQTPNGAESVKKIANSTGITTPCTPKEEWNAGNDAKYLIDIWSKMTKGLSIQEQFELEQQTRLAAPAPPPPNVSQDNDDEDNWDPNTVMQQTPVFDPYDEAPSDDEE